MKGDPLPWYLSGVVAVGVVGAAAAYGVPKDQAGRMAAFWGVSGATVTGAVALSLKKWALSRSVRTVLAVTGALFAVRLAMAALGVAYEAAKGRSPVPFVVGFLGAYFVLQWVEISYVLAESRRRGSGGV